ncbi:MAG: hypothetical protein ACI88C_001995 [Acidimicrobiales bacterium]
MLRWVCSAPSGRSSERRWCINCKGAHASWLKGWESRLVGFGWSAPQLEPPTPLRCELLKLAVIEGAGLGRVTQGQDSGVHGIWPMSHRPIPWCTENRPSRLGIELVNQDSSVTK